MVDKKSSKSIGAKAPLISSVKLFDFSIISVVIIIILLGAIGYMYFSGCESLSAGGSSGTGDYCSENIIPDYVIFRTLQSEIADGPRDYGDITSTWKDETPMASSPKWLVQNIDLRCTSDSQYFYCNNLYYAKTSVNSAGESGEVKEYLIDLVLDKGGQEVVHYHPEGWTATLALNVKNNVVSHTCVEV